MVLRLSYLLFLVSGSIHLLIGVLTPIFLGRTGISMVIMSPRTDRVFFGVELQELLAADASLRSLRSWAGSPFAPANYTRPSGW